MRSPFLFVSVSVSLIIVIQGVVLVEATTLRRRRTTVTQVEHQNTVASHNDGGGGGGNQQRPQQRRIVNNENHCGPSRSDENGGSFDLPPLITNNVFHLTELIDLTKQVRLSDDDNPGGHYDSFRVFEDWDDLAIVASRNGNCFSAFRATVSTNVFDIIQLFDWREKTIGTCTVRGGFWNAFYSRYYDEYMEAIDNCMTMNGNNAQLIIGGHSQGGSIAVVASVGLQKYKEQMHVVTFGATKTFLSICQDIDPNQHYRFVNAAENMYDKWPMKFNNMGVHMGHTILLDPGSTNLAAYVGLNDNTNRSPCDWDMHKTHWSYDALSKLVGSGCNPINIGGWEDGHICYGDEECNGSCIDNKCRSS